MVLLILAGVTINSITGSENAMEKAQEAKTKTDIAAAKEQAELITLGYVQDYLNGKYVGSDGTYENELAYIASQYATNPTHGNYKITVANRKITVSDLSNNEIVSGNIDEDGIITWVENGEQNEIPIASLQTAATKPYLPTGYRISQESIDAETASEGGALAAGLVITDGENEYVWVEVPRTTDVYKNEELAYNLDNLTGTDLDNAYNAIEGAMQTYAREYRTKCKEQKSDDKGYRDEYNSNMGTIGNITSSNYNTEKRKMLKSVFENGGFYVGRFEAGIAISCARNKSTDSKNPFDSSIKPLSQANVAPLNYVTCSEAQTLAKNVAPSGYTSSLMFGIQWDLMLKFMNAGTDTSDSWGNYSGQEFSVNSSAQGCNYFSKKYEDIASDIKSENILLTTGATLGAGANANRNSKLNIHDVAGNVLECTLEYTSSTINPYCYRGGYYALSGFYYPAVNRYDSNAGTSGDIMGFRVTIY